MKLPHLFIPSKTATLVPEFAVEDLPLGRTAAFVPEFAVKDLPLDRKQMMKHGKCMVLFPSENFIATPAFQKLKVNTYETIILPVVLYGCETCSHLERGIRE